METNERDWKRKKKKLGNGYRVERKNWLTEKIRHQFGGAGGKKGP